ncbi:PREDICTED: uncharacterized protein LOC108619720 [Drosophila arizonae]|uniref:Uncharacterized protein LOC108619720 n=1 Tax=Drosophila arizonae TaxID=7263 RepID=A0ABM1PXL4_DROAR|nr:PREDICTED: uncharacterized protein LOC108619720 [Drosophila arizonae]
MALMLVPMECMMRNWLDAWRSLNKDCVQVTKTASRLKKLIFLAVQQIYCYELILLERKILNNKFIKCISDAGEMSNKRLTGSCKLRSEHQAILGQLVGLKLQLSERNNTLVKFKLELHFLRQRLRQQTFKTNRMTARLKHNKLLAEKLLERNSKLSSRSLELLELYRMRALMFVFKLIGMAQELIVTKTKSKAYEDASEHLKCKNRQLQLRQRILIKKFTKRTSQDKIHTDTVNGARNIFDTGLHYLDFLWNCVSSLAQCPKVQGPGRRCEWALV